MAKSRPSTNTAPKLWCAPAPRSAPGVHPRGQPRLPRAVPWRR